MRIDEDLFVGDSADPQAMSAGLTRLAGSAAPADSLAVRGRLVLVCSDGEASAATLGRIGDAMTSLRSARLGIESGDPGSADLARISLIDAHDRIQELSSNSGCGADMAVHLRNRYFGILQQVGTEGMSEELVSEINHFMVDNPDGSMTVEYADHSNSIEVETGSMIEVSEGAHVESGSTISCETTGEVEEAPLPGGGVIVTEAVETCLGTPPSE